MQPSIELSKDDAVKLWTKNWDALTAVEAYYVLRVAVQAELKDLEKSRYVRTRPIVVMVKKALTNTTEDFIKAPKVPEGTVHHYLIAAAEDETTQDTRTKIGIQAGKEYIWLANSEAPAADVVAPISREIIVGPGNRLIAGFEGVTANDLCRLYASGYVTNVKD